MDMNVVVYHSEGSSRSEGISYWLSLWVPCIYEWLINTIKMLSDQVLFTLDFFFFRFGIFDA